MTGAQEEQNALVNCHSAPFESTDGEDQTRATVTSSDCVHSHVRSHSHVHLQICSLIFFFFVKLWHSKETKRKKRKILTCC